MIIANASRLRERRCMYVGPKDGNTLSFFSRLFGSKFLEKRSDTSQLQRLGKKNILNSVVMYSYKNLVSTKLYFLSISSVLLRKINHHKNEIA